MDNARDYIIDIFSYAQYISDLIKDKQDLTIAEIEIFRSIAFKIIARLDYMQEEKEY